MALLSNKLLRSLIVFSNWLAWIGAVIVMSFESYFIHLWNGTIGEHLIYEEVVATAAVAFYLPALFLPLSNRYRAWFLPVHFAFAFLWLTAFVFAAQDWNWHGCTSNAPVGVASCSRKYATEAFIFVAFFFTGCSLVLEALLWHEIVLETHSGTQGKRETAPSSIATEA